MTEKRFEHDGKNPPLHIEENARLGEIAEAEVCERNEMIRNDLVAALRAVLAERIIRNPEEEMRRSTLLHEARSRVLPRTPSSHRSDGHP